MTMSMRRRAGIALLAVVTSGAAASATPMEATTVDVLVPRANVAASLPAYLAQAGRTGDAAAAVRRWQVDAALAAGVPRDMVLAAQAAQAGPDDRLALRDGETSVVLVSSDGAAPAMSFLQPAADLNGDGTRDLLDLRYGSSRSGEGQVATTARSGSTGAVLWHRLDAMPPGHFVFPLATSVGPAAHPGVVLFDSGSEKRSGGTIEVTDRLTALAGSTGKRLWQHADKGTLDLDDGFTGKHLPSLVGLLQVAAGAKDALMTFSDFSDDFNGNEKGAVAVYRIRGRDGAAVRAGATITSQDSVPYVEGFPDLSGDRRQDYVVLVSGSTPSVQARRAVDGSVIWTSTELALNQGAFALPAGRVTGAGVEDLAVSTGTAYSQVPSFFTPVGEVSDPTTPKHGQVGLVRGDTGALVWQQTGDGAFRVERAGPARVPAVGVTTAETTSDADGTTTETLHLLAYDAAGGELYDRTYTQSAPAEGDDSFSFGFAAAFAIGDLGPDGAQDGLAFLFATSGGRFYERTFLFDGATGDAVPGQHEGLYGSLTGSGDDLVDVKVGSSIAVTALRGRDQKRLFSTTLPVPGMQRATAFAERIRGRCADVLVEARGKTNAYAGVLTAKGTPRWTISHKVGDLRPTPARRGTGGTSSVCA